MCLGIPGQIVEMHTATSTSRGSTSTASAGSINIGLLEDEHIASATGC